MHKNLNFARENRADGGGERARQRNIKSARFHALPNSEIYTSEYVQISAKKTGPRLCELSPAARGGQDAASRNLGLNIIQSSVYFCHTDRTSNAHQPVMHVN